ncbi:uncharacterized protein BO95DRAFT_40586 [Aspergillus brunneoviolaceus CBS 621.78]|uniref:Uncharacterized protein n=1 Tax=Aspergillus brunneoviolaceus CBS 621.78 TaxID=1450534 RepID=A0ACD1FS12_9EURO|nr:hypothetical protein BO95DRAFT_40586 [Aspergillus brunneoviolaceus CBS 621.78]RAH39772.1 hypothetical protein BO95DRAFT_40586 [Aspergillus brunneoviolaceus CBS 621.78]
MTACKMTLSLRNVLASKAIMQNSSFYLVTKCSAGMQACRPKTARTHARLVADTAASTDVDVSTFIGPRMDTQRTLDLNTDTPELFDDRQALVGASRCILSSHDA